MIQILNDHLPNANFFSCRTSSVSELCRFSAIGFWIIQGLHSANAFVQVWVSSICVILLHVGHLWWFPDETDGEQKSVLNTAGFKRKVRWVWLILSRVSYLLHFSCRPVQNLLSVKTIKFFSMTSSFWLSRTFVRKKPKLCTHVCGCVGSWKTQDSIVHAWTSAFSSKEFHKSVVKYSYNPVLLVQEMFNCTLGEKYQVTLLGRKRVSTLLYLFHYK